jgi:alkanesulfonate monooxygenase SsuD/methylene tetrahydromethanopterin reductase-like flavin-dependent oxidoreductase (luciferase family)
MKADIKKELHHRISGSPQQCLQRIKDYAHAGINRLILIFFDPQDVDTFAREVMPELKDQT